MTRPDPAIAWLLKNDPEARQKSQNSYLRDRGIVSRTRAGEIAEAEVTLSAAEKHQLHCPGCETRYAMHRPVA